MDTLDASDIIWRLLLQLVLIFLNAVFACAEIAVLSMNETKLEKLASQGNKRAKKLGRMKENPARFLATIQVAITLSGFLGSAFAASSFSEPIVNAFLKAGVDAQYKSVISTLSVIIITLLLSFVTLVFGELVPKRLAMKKTEAFALGLSGTISFISTIFAPLVFLLTVSTNGILRLLRIDPNSEEGQVSEEEIRMMVDAGGEKGIIDSEEQQMIQNVFEFDDLTVGEFATHRTDTTILWLDEDITQWEETIHESRHSMFPVCGETADDLIGILNAKDYFRLSDKSRQNVMHEAVKPAYFIPENVKADVLFKQMKKTRNHFAVVLDEYGGVFGIVTMNDLLEQIVGDIDNDEDAPNEVEEITRVNENTWRLCGSAMLDDVNDKLGTTLPDDEYDTFGGLVFGCYGSVPNDGENFSVDIGNVHVDVNEIKEHRVESATVTVNLPEEESVVNE